MLENLTNALVQTWKFGTIGYITEPVTSVFSINENDNEIGR